MPTVNALCFLNKAAACWQSLAYCIPQLFQNRLSFHILISIYHKIMCRRDGTVQNRILSYLLIDLICFKSLILAIRHWIIRLSLFATSLLQFSFYSATECVVKLPLNPDKGAHIWFKESLGHSIVLICIQFSIMSACFDGYRRAEVDVKDWGF